MNRRAIAQFTRFTAISSHSSIPSKVRLETVVQYIRRWEQQTSTSHRSRISKPTVRCPGPRREFFSVLNHPQLAFLKTNVNNSTFGVAVPSTRKEDSQPEPLMRFSTHIRSSNLQPEWIPAKAAVKEIADRAASGAEMHKRNVWVAAIRRRTVNAEAKEHESRMRI